MGRRYYIISLRGVVVWLYIGAATYPWQVGRRPLWTVRNAKKVLDVYI